MQNFSCFDFAYCKRNNISHTSCLFRVLFPAWNSLSHCVDVVTPTHPSRWLCYPLQEAPQEPPYSLGVSSMASGTPSFTTLHQLRLFVRSILPTLDYIQLDGKTVLVYGSIYLSLALGTWQTGSDHPGEIYMTPQCNWGTSEFIWSQRE